MKKTFIVISTAIVTALAIQSCNKPVDNTQAWKSVDSIANASISMFRDSLKMACMNGVMTAAQAKADSMMQAAMKKPGSKPAPKKPAPAAQQPSGLKGLSDQSNKQSGGLKSTSDQSQEKAKETGKGGLKGLSDQSKQAPPPPPKQ